MFSQTMWTETETLVCQNFQEVSFTFGLSPGICIGLTEASALYGNMLAHYGERWNGPQIGPCCLNHCSYQLYIFRLCERGSQGDGSPPLETRVKEVPQKLRPFCSRMLKFWILEEKNQQNGKKYRHQKLGLAEWEGQAQAPRPPKKYAPGSHHTLLLLLLLLQLLSN